MSKRSTPSGEDTTAGDGLSSRGRYFWLAIPFVWAAILVALEGSLRLVGFGSETRLFDPVEPGMLVDNSDYTARFHPYGDGYEPVQKTNLFTREKRAGRLRLFVVGGSTAQGYPARRNHSFSAMAEAGLRAVGVDAEIINVGNSAMSSYYVREVLQDVRRYEPDMVVVYAGHNEYYGTPSSFTGGTHALRLALLELRRLRLVQLLDRAIVAASNLGADSSSTSTLMERRFAETLFPPDAARDGQVAEVFVRNIDAGFGPLIDAGVSAIVFEPVSNLVSMPPFRSPESAASDTAGGQAGPRGPTPLEAFLRRHEELESAEWKRTAWEEVKDLDHAPFRARSTLVRALERYAASEPSITWIPTGAELERRLGPAAFGDTLFIDHLHFNFKGQKLLAALLAEAVVKRFYFSDPRLLSSLQSYFDDGERVRADIHLTDFWEFEAYTRIASMQSREPFASMPLPKSAPAVPERVQRNPLFRSRAFLDSLEGAAADDLLYLALDHYRREDRDEWIRNMNAYVHLFPGHYQSQLAYGVALLEDGGAANLDAAGSYIRRAYSLSGRSPEVVEASREALERQGMAGAWEGFRARYLD